MLQRFYGQIRCLCLKREREKKYQKPELKPVLINKKGQWNLLQEFNNWKLADILLEEPEPDVTCNCAKVCNGSCYGQISFIKTVKFRSVAFKRMFGV